MPPAGMKKYRRPHYVAINGTVWKLNDRKYCQLLADLDQDKILIMENYGKIVASSVVSLRFLREKYGPQFRRKA